LPTLCPSQRRQQRKRDGDDRPLLAGLHPAGRVEVDADGDEIDLLPGQIEDRAAALPGVEGDQGIEGVAVPCGRDGFPTTSERVIQ
jgi:hypothetical protein